MWFACLIAFVAGGVAAAADQQPIRFALTHKIFWENEPNDVIPQAQLVADRIGENIGRKVVVHEYGDDITEVMEDLVSGEVHFVISDGLDYVRIRSGRIAAGVTAKPVSLRISAAVLSPPHERGAEAGCTRALLMARSDPSLKAFSDLRGKRFVYGPRVEKDSSMLFVDGLLRRQGFRDKEEFFGSVKRLSSEDACLFALQLGSADVTCIHDEMLLAKMLVTGKELKGLNTLCTSEPHAGYLCFYRVDGVEEELAEQIRQELLALHEDPAGAKLLGMFNVNCFVPIREETVLPIEELLREAEPPGGEARAAPG